MFVTGAKLLDNSDGILMIPGYVVKEDVQVCVCVCANPGLRSTWIFK